MQIYEISDREALFYLSTISELGYSAKKAIYENIKPLYNIFKMSFDEVQTKVKLNEKQINAILRLKLNLDNLHDTYLSLDYRKIKFILPFDEDYPQKLIHIKDYPFGIFVKGEIPKQRKSVSIVGSRGASQYGLEMASFLARELAINGVDIISGMALGVDTKAHEGAILGEGKTYAVLGTGVNVCYPESNFNLYNKLCSDGFGGVISEFPLGTNPLKFNFPIRNRIISGLADITIVIEARLKSGSLITASHALEQGREVFALPGRITDCMSLGCNKLIADGAGIISSPTDVLEALDLNIDRKIQVYNEKNPNILAKNDKKVYSCLDLKPKYIDDIIKESTLDISQVLSSLLLLELEGFIVQISSNYYCKRIN